MGQCYIITAEFKYPDARQEKIVKTLKDYILDRQANSRADFNLDKYAAKGYTPDTWEGVMTLLFTDRGTEISDHSISASFDASYGWFTVMVKAFESITHLLDDGSEMVMETDDGTYTYTISRGKVVQDYETYKDEEEEEGQLPTA